MKKWIAFALTLVMGAGLVSCTGNAGNGSSTAGSSSGSGASSSAGASGGVLVYGTSADYAPFEFHILDNGVDTIVGLDVSLAHKIAEDMGAELNITDMAFENLLTLMAKGDCDYVIAAMETTDERLNAATPSDPYYTDLPAMILVKRENADQYTTFADFSGKVVGAQSGTTKADMITEYMPGATPVMMTSVVDLVNNLVYDKCDALILDGAVAIQYANANEDLVVIEAEGVSLGEALPYCVWVAKGDPKGLLPSINATIAQVLADGTMERYIAEADALSSQALEG